MKKLLPILFIFFFACKEKQTSPTTSGASIELIENDSPKYLLLTLDTSVHILDIPHVYKRVSSDDSDPGEYDYRSNSASTHRLPYNGYIDSNQQGELNPIIPLPNPFTDTVPWGYIRLDMEGECNPYNTKYITYEWVSSVFDEKSHRHVPLWSVETGPGKDTLITLLYANGDTAFHFHKPRKRFDEGKWYFGINGDSAQYFKLLQMMELENEDDLTERIYLDTMDYRPIHHTSPNESGTKPTRRKRLKK